MRKTYKKNKEINTKKLKINPKNTAQKSITKSSRDLREKYKKTKTKTKQQTKNQYQ
jgi:hypothetical protein